MKLFAKAAPLLLLLLTSCAGGGEHSTPGEGTLRLSIEWPEATRLVPVASKSIVITASVTKGEGEDAVTERITQKIVPRPATGNLSNVEMKLPSTKVTIQADACPNADGTGNVQATAKKEVTIPESRTTPIEITMVTRIQRVSMTPNPDGSTLLVDAGGTYEASAESDGDILVITSPSKWTWTSSDTTVLGITSDGSKVTVKGLKEGRVTLTATEDESHRTKSAVVNVKAREEDVLMPDGRYEGLITYSIITTTGTFTRIEREAITLSSNYISHFWVIGYEYRDLYLSDMNRAVTKREADGSITFTAEGYTDDQGLVRGDYAVMSGTFNQGTITISIEYFRDNVPSIWKSGAGVMSRKDK